MFGYNKRKKETVEELRKQFLDVIDNSLFLSASHGVDLIENENLKSFPIALINALQIEPALFFKFLIEAGQGQKEKLQWAIDLDKLRSEEKFKWAKLYSEQMLCGPDQDYFSNSVMGPILSKGILELTETWHISLITLSCYFFMSSW